MYIDTAIKTVTGLAIGALLLGFAKWLITTALTGANLAAWLMAMAM